MSIRTTLVGTRESGRNLGLSAAEQKPWVRNPSWTALPDVTGLQKFAGLHAVFEGGSNFVALSAEGNYTVNWGDGSGDTNVSSGVTAERNIAWADATNTTDVGIASAVACTFTDSGDKVNLTAHGWSNGQKVAFSSITSTTGISTYTTYYVVNKNANDFQVSTTIGGSAVTLTTDGSGSVYVPKYRQVIVTVVPNGGNLTKLDLHIKHSTTGLQTYSSGWLDIVISAQYMTDLRLGVLVPGSTSQSIRHTLLEQFSLVSSDLRQLFYLFYACSSLRNIGALVTSSAVADSGACTFTDSTDLVTRSSHGFRDGDMVLFTSITSTTGISVGTPYFVRDSTSDTFKLASSHGGSVVPLTTDGSGTSLRGTCFIATFNNCYALTSVPLFNTASATSFNSMFSTCLSLVSVPLFNSSAVTNCSAMFNTCRSLVSVPLFDTSAVTNFSIMFANCTRLTSVPLFNTAAGTTCSLMFNNCYSLVSIPLFDTSAVTNFSDMFNGCYSLVSVPAFNTAAGTNFSAMFLLCYSLASVPLFNTSAGTNFASMFNGCLSLFSVPLFDVSASTGFSSMFSSCTSLKVGTLAGTAQSISYGGCNLSAAQLDEIYTNLATVTSKTITVTNNWGNASDTPSIATDKGWTVTG